VTCLHVRVLKDGKVHAVRNRETTKNGVIYHLCDSIGKYIGFVSEHECKLLDF